LGFAIILIVVRWKYTNGFAWAFCIRFGAFFLKSPPQHNNTQSAMNLLRPLSFRRKSSKQDNTSTNGPISDIDFLLRLGSASIEGTGHPNEDHVYQLEDLHLLVSPPTFLPAKIAFVSCFDGHGGGGCSSYLNENLQMKIVQNPCFKSFADAQTVLMDAFKSCEDEWNEFAEKNQDNSGSCALACLISGLDIVFAHAGDCRAVCRIGKRTFQLTKDHRPSDPAEKARIYAAGGFIKNGRVMGSLAPSRGFGDLDVKKKALSMDVVISEPEITTCKMEPSVAGLPSFVVLATDGIWDCMPPERAMDVVSKSLAKYNDEEQAAVRLCQVAAELNSDDCSAVVVIFPAIS
jgi:protein phosphatase 2C family protein 2/3